MGTPSLVNDDILAALRQLSGQTDIMYTP